MSSPNWYPEDELDHLVHGALKARVSGKEPPDRVWKHIKAELQAEGSPPPRPSRIAWAPLAMQAALTLLLVAIGGIGLQTLLDSDYVRYSPRDVSPSQTIAYVEEQSASPGVPMFDDEAELRSLKAASRPRPESQPDAEPNDYPPLMVPRDFPPHAMSPEGRALESKLFMRRLAVEEQNLPHSGPYRSLK